MRQVFTFLFVFACYLSGAQQIIVEKWTPINTSRYYWGMTYLPVDYNNTTASFPLIVFAHGLGESYEGTADSADVPAQLYRTGIPKYVKAGNNIPFLVFAPQTANGQWNNDDIFKMINAFKAKYRVDPNRIYFTGISMGGRAIMKYLLEKPNPADSIAAVAPVSMHYEVRDSTIWKTFSRWKPKQTMLVMGTADNAAPYNRYTNSIRYRDSINANGGIATLKAVPGGHYAAVWDSVYYKVTKVADTLDLYSWLLQHTSRPVVSPTRIKIEKWIPVNTNRFYWGMTYLPTNYQNSDSAYPLIIYLHGAGQGYQQSGSADSTDIPYYMYSTGLPQYLAFGNDIPFLVFAPQSRIGQWDLHDLNKIINSFKAKYRVDRNRIYLTGVSMGARALIKYFLETPAYSDSIIAAAPLGTHYMAADSTHYNLSDNWAGKKIWTTVGINDTINDRYDNCVRITDSINANGGEAWLTAVRNAGHDDAVWNNVYHKRTKFRDSLDLYAWLLRYTLEPATAPVTTKNILIDAGNPAYTTINNAGVKWNNITSGSPGVWISSVIDTAGVTHNLSISADKRPGGTYANPNDISVNSNGIDSSLGKYPASAVRDNIYFHPSAGIVTLTFTIPAGKKADITFWGTREGTGPRILQVRKAGDSLWKEYDGAYNHTVANNATLTDCYGTQLVEARTKAGSTFGHISVIEIALRDSVSTLRTAQPFIATARSAPVNYLDRTVKLLNNPAKEQAILQINNELTGKMQITLINGEGKLIKSYFTNKQTGYLSTVINTSGLSTGSYFIQIKLDKQHTTRRLVVVK
ncbi:prolyl oligopeptidase family serine peptidase [Longitalea luteola]|uniref:prolyl oligopeptidase family serine peptidase n=1 Tax=Longitalea luteola TaxID=2812563 RepID=UPI001A95DAD0|nr:prolyl oligopeptidase family serine peptidase [Longitalea luteola]